ncbi:hypothetical protein ORU02_23550, partial [Escherichia coli]|nr:hypothetical protein [Escherichia coli]
APSAKGDDKFITTDYLQQCPQISGGETRQDYKDPRRFPLVAPSCALLFLPFGLPVSFRCYGRGFSFHA